MFLQELNNGSNVIKFITKPIIFKNVHKQKDTQQRVKVRSIFGHSPSFPNFSIANNEKVSWCVAYCIEIHKEKQ
jgi:hypothetical protein